MRDFNLYIPTKIHFGRNVLDESINKEKDVISGNVLIVTTGRSLVRLGYLDDLKQKIKTLDSVNDVFVFENISANPQVSEIQKAVDFAKELKIDVVIGFGGGSAIDAAKAAAAAIPSECSVSDFFYKGIAPDKKTLPIVAIPTTAGTGSELSKAAIVSDNANNKKGGIRGERLYPAVAIVDSFYTESVPLNITMETGFDVLAHAIESYVSVAACDFTRTLSLEAVKIVSENLPLLAKNLSDKDARKKMSYASMIMGINLGNASTCLPHRLQYPLGARTKSSHGAGLAAMFPAWLYYEYDYSKDKIDTIFNIMFGKKPESKEACAFAMRDFLKSLSLKTSTDSFGVSEDLIRTMASEVSGNIKNDPASQEENIIEKIYTKSFQEF